MVRKELQEDGEVRKDILDIIVTGSSHKDIINSRSQSYRKR